MVGVLLPDAFIIQNGFQPIFPKNYSIQKQPLILVSMSNTGNGKNKK